MKKLLLLIAAVCALVLGGGEMVVGDSVKVEPAMACSATTSCCDSVEVSPLVDFMTVDSANACGGAAGLAWRVAGPYGVWWAGWCSNLGASAWVGNEYWHCTWFYG